MILSSVQIASAALLLLARVSECGRDWTNQEVIPNNGSSSLLQSKAMVQEDDCKNEMDSSEQPCCPDNLRFSTPRLKMDFKGCNCFCGMADATDFSGECWQDPSDSNSQFKEYKDAEGESQKCCPLELALGPHRRLVSEISQCNCWCGQAAKEDEKFFGPDSWTHQLALRTLASMQDDTEGVAGESGDLAASMDAVGHLQKKRRTRDRKERQAAENLLGAEIEAETERMGHSPNVNETALLKSVMAEWKARKDKEKGDTGLEDKDRIQNFAEFAGPEVMSLYMDKARAAMLSERDVREQADKVVEHLINKHMDFRNKNLEWADRQNSFNDLLAHAENYLQQSEPGRKEDQLYMGLPVTRPVNDMATGDRGLNKHWGDWKPETLGRSLQHPIFDAGVNSKYMYKHVANQAQGEYTGAINIPAAEEEDEPRVADMKFNILANTLYVENVAEGARVPVKLGRPDINKITISWRTPDDGKTLFLSGVLDNDGKITGDARYDSDTGQKTPIGTFSLEPAKARLCGPRQFQKDRFCCPKELLNVNPSFLVTKPQGQCDCMCGKLPD